MGAIGGGIALFLTIVEDACLERLQSLGERVASFAHVPSAIAGRRQHAGQEGLRVVRAGAGGLRSRDALPGTTGQHHRAARGADRADHRTLRVGPGERHAACDEGIEVRGEESRSAERTQTVGPVVVGVDVQDVRPRRQELPGEAGREQKKESAHGAYFLAGAFLAGGFLPWALTTLGLSIFLEPEGRVAWSKARTGPSSRTLRRTCFT